MMPLAGHRLVVPQNRERCCLCPNRIDFARWPVGYRDNPEAGLGMLVLWDHGHPVGCPQIFFGGVMASSTCDPIKSLLVTDGVDLRIGQVKAIPIQAPFLDISVHIVETERVGRCLAHFERDLFQVACGLLVLVEDGRQSVASVKREIITRMACIFPFRLGRQPIILTFFFA